MRTDNRKVKNTIISTYFVLILLAVLLGTVFNSYQLFESSSLYVLIGLLITVGIVHFVARYFEYDSDGAKIIITNSGLILNDFFNYREHKVEISKEKLSGFKIKNYLFYKSLIIYTTQSNGKIATERFNITLLKRKKTKFIKQSLIKIIKENKKNKQG
ncbi:hypothetical protein DFQ11_102302 [Winogradskyella epiphytica]|uniref:PH (Pleckstrin Homology) domain-containing protein n=1 Tax=Winogradskyella epiphytica TaxID=262005 RepID=A0A2V4XZZ1_9FLAO|nr:hypothetical protein [Winogradskyella epiphytica]PYE81728.1 hypothetical protein DFQ11_102302 [Winogradskyella epiphytica]GGW63086.1 hypothetical protein GCM10008085_13670 [Winogradskyella epiphytica]